MKNKQTAVEWLNEQMNNIKGSSISMNGSVQFIEKELNNLLEQAKAMEKDKQKNTFVEGMYKGQELYFGEHKIKLDVNSLNYSLNIAEDYYNKTFKSE